MKGRRTTPNVDPDAAELGEILSDLRDRISDLEQADQGSERSIDDGALDIYDDDDNLRGRIGRQSDGSFGVKAYGKKPETPTEPDVIPVPGGCIVEWDGTFDEAQVDDVQRVAIHVGTTPGFAINTDDDEDSDEESTEKAAILSPRGGSAFLALDPGQETYYVRLTAVAEGGIESDPTDAVEVIVAAPEAAFYQDEFVLAAAGAQALSLTFTPLDHSDHLYWNGLYQREDLAWTRLGKVVTLTGTPYAAKVGDRVTVEYAYNPGEEPKPVPLDGNAQRFYGNDDSYLYVAPDIDAADWSLEFLYKLVALPPARRTIAQQSNGVPINQGWWLHVDPDGSVFLRWKDENPADLLDFTWIESAKVPLPADLKAHQYVIRWDDSAKRAGLWIDGVERTSVTLPRSADKGHDLIIGGEFFGTNAPDGILDEVSGYTRLLTPAEIVDHFDAWSYGRYPSTILDDSPTWYFRMDDAIGSDQVLDLVTGTDQGNIQGGATHNAEPPLQKGE